MVGGRVLTLDAQPLVPRHLHNFLFIETTLLTKSGHRPSVICMLYCPHKSALI